MEETRRRPLHERSPLLRAPRAWLRSAFFSVLRTAANTDDGRTILKSALDDLTQWRPEMSVRAFDREVPYPDLGRRVPLGRSSGPRPIVITARFRSGSTLLWNIFRHLDDCTAYYEPFNERRWFDPSHRGTRVDGTHKNIEEYWREFEGLEGLAAFYQEDWIRRRLYMDERSWDPDMAAYVRFMIERAKGRAVLQCNRIDFRVAWFRHMFPDAALVHLYRHPRDQWCSSLVNLSECPLSCTVEEFTPRDHFYLTVWAADLKHRFPFLDASRIAHPYQMFYFVWKLSYLFGRAYAHHSIGFEALVSNPDLELRRLFDAIDMPGVDIGRLSKLVEPTPSRWQRYANDAWFKAHEEACEAVLQDFFTAPAVASEMPQGFRAQALAAIR